jgi:peptidoglycan hydrolase CwlO-like protein
MKYFVAAFFLVTSLFFSISKSVYAQTNAQQQAELQRELAEVEKEQAETEKILADTQAQSASLKRDILILDTKIKAAELNIKAKNLTIQTLGKDINDKEHTISNLSDRIDKGRDSLAQILRKTNEVGTITIPELVLSGNSVSDVFIDLDTFSSVESSLKTTFEQIRTDKAQTETEKNALDKRRNAEIDARAAIQKDEKNIASDQTEKQRLLTISKGNEKTYSAVLADKEKRAAQIRAALFALAGGGQAIPFGTALSYANEVKQKTGIDPAFLLAILTQESNLGANVGKCYLTDLGTGAGVNPASGRTFPNVMKPGRDIPPYLNIVNSLGLSPTQTFVSCPIPSAGGWGGAMGPAQFIASTWVLFTDRISKMLNVGIPNPWSPREAFTASALYLSDLGAIGSSYSSEIRAACKYYGTGGSSCAYGRSVMGLADSIQRTMIDPLQGV